MGCIAYRILATMSFGTVDIRMEFPCGRPSAFLCVASTWILGIGWYFWPENSSFWIVVE